MAAFSSVSGLMFKEYRSLSAVAYNIRTVFKSDTTLRPHLLRPKDTVDPAKQEGVVYRIPRECGNVYIWVTGKPVQERIKRYDSLVPRPLLF